MLSSNSNRRTSPSNNPKRSMVDTGSSEWELTEGMIKMRINGDDVSKMRTPHQRNSVVPGHEGSPLESSDASLDSNSPSDQHLGLPSHSRGSSTDTSLSQHSSSSQTLQGGPYERDWSSREQPSYPSLAARDQDFQVDYSAQLRQYSQSNLSFSQPRVSAGGAAANVQFRQPQPTRGFNPQLQGVASNPSFTYNSPLVSIGNTQQLYDVMMPPQDAAIARAQPQAFRSTHQPSSSDPATIRDTAALQLLPNNLQPFTQPGLYPPLSIFYTPESYQPADIAAQLMAARLQSQYQGAFVNGAQALSGSTGSVTPNAASAQAAPTGNGPSANNRKLGLYKTELCRSWEEKGSCRYGTKCQFAHGEEELRRVPRHPKYKTEICRTFWVSGSCPYGKRCCFIHTELPANGAAPPDGTPPPSQQDGRARSSSTNSDPNDTSGSSLLARISAKRNQDANTSGSASSTPPTATGPSSRPPIGSLRVDTSVLDPLSSSAKQNKSAYPMLANGMLIQANAPAPIMTHGPVTAGPDFGRHASARLDIVGQNTQRMSKHQSRSSYNGSDNGMEPVAQSPVTATGDSPLGNIPRTASRGGSSGHMRSGSTGNWNVSRSSNLRDSYALTAGPDGKASAPWLTDVSSRLQEQTWV